MARKRALPARFGTYEKLASDRSQVSSVQRVGFRIRVTLPDVEVVRFDMIRVLRTAILIQMMVVCLAMDVLENY